MGKKRKLQNGGAVTLKVAQETKEDNGNVQTVSPPIDLSQVRNTLAENVKNMYKASGVLIHSTSDEGTRYLLSLDIRDQKPKWNLIASKRQDQDGNVSGRTAIRAVYESMPEGQLRDKILATISEQSADVFWMLRGSFVLYVVELEYNNEKIVPINKKKYSQFRWMSQEEFTKGEIEGKKMAWFLDSQIKGHISIGSRDGSKKKKKVKTEEQKKADWEKLKKKKKEKKAKAALEKKDKET
ncbi:hypothetical protein PROFUN_01810 [Planoprotostelium fungivorum]|uniref:Uncharacterized protein n=1 Tax=Planoprotostelium fungivorum TaxID=1890364 RepID=A0A2P6NYQ2_9EUKA|nr:hypothetical protein PROFUN_01810 [Planoprotostelium fungivorum]